MGGDEMGYNIKKFREKKYPGRGGQARCAKALGVTPQTWNQYEKAKGLHQRTLEKIARFFKVPVAALIADADAVTPTEQQSAPTQAYPLSVPTAGKMKMSTTISIAGRIMARGNAKSPDERKGYSNERNLIFSEKVRVRRLILDLKQSELGDKVGMTPKQISELEGGRFVSDATRVIELARALETTPDYLFGFRDEP